MRYILIFCAGLQGAILINAKSFKELRDIEWSLDRPKRLEDIETATPKDAAFIKIKMPATTYSPTIKGSTIGEDKLNFSVRNGKRCTLISIITGKIIKKDEEQQIKNRAEYYK
jgi:hypothetical protein